MINLEIVGQTAFWQEWVRSRGTLLQLGDHLLQDIGIATTRPIPTARIRTTLLAAAAVVGLFSATASAQSGFTPSGPRLVGEGDNPHVEYDAPSANIVGIAEATVTGAPDQTQYETLRVFRTQAPSLARNPSQIVVDSSN